MTALFSKYWFGLFVVLPVAKDRFWVILPARLAGSFPRLPTTWRISLIGRLEVCGHFLSEEREVEPVPC